MDITTIIAYLLIYRYALIIPLTILDGPIIMLVGGFMLRLGLFDFLPLYVALMIGDLLGDTIWYIIGATVGRRAIGKFGKYFSITPEAVEKVKHLFHRYNQRVLVISKITMGFGFAVVTLFTAGLVRIPFRKYLLFNAIGQLFWTALLLSAGYLFGNLYLIIDKGFRDITIIGCIIILGFLVYGFGKYIHRRAYESL